MRKTHWIFKCSHEISTKKNDSEKKWESVGFWWLRPVHDGASDLNVSIIEFWFERYQVAPFFLQNLSNPKDFNIRQNFFSFNFIARKASNAEIQSESVINIPSGTKVFASFDNNIVKFLSRIVSITNFFQINCTVWHFRCLRHSILQNGIPIACELCTQRKRYWFRISINLTFNACYFTILPESSKRWVRSYDFYIIIFKFNRIDLCVLHAQCSAWISHRNSIINLFLLFSIPRQWQPMELFEWNKKIGWTEIPLFSVNLSTTTTLCKLPMPHLLFDS